jgi:hypothetical protein
LTFDGNRSGGYPKVAWFVHTAIVEEISRPYFLAMSLAALDRGVMGI